MKYVSHRNSKKKKKVIKRRGQAKPIGVCVEHIPLPIGLYQSRHTVNVSLKLPFYKTAFKSDVAWHLKAKIQRERTAGRKAGRNTDLPHAKSIGHSQMW